MTVAGSAALAFRIFATDNTSKTFDKIGRSADGLAGKLGTIGKVSGIAALGLTALGVVGVAGLAAVIASVGILGAGIAGIGLAFAAQNSRVQRSFSALSTRVQADMRHMSSVFVPVLLHLSSVLGHVFDDASPTIAKAFGRLAPVTQRMVDGVGGALHGLIPAIQPVLDAAIPLLDRLAAHLPGIGAAAGRMLIRVSGFVQRITPEIKPALDRAADVARTGAAKIGDGIAAVLGNPTVKKIRAAIPGWTDTVVGAVTKMATGVKDRAVGLATGLIGGFQKGLSTGNWRDLGKTLGGLVKDQIGRALKVATTITEKLGEAIGKVDWVGLGLKIGREAPSLAVGFVAGLFGFDMGNALHGVMVHWSDILLGLIAIALPPLKVAGKIGEALARIPVVGKLLSWTFTFLNRWSRKAIGFVGKTVGKFGKAILDGITEKFPAAGGAVAKFLGELPTRMGVVGLEITAKAKAMVEGLGRAIEDGAKFVGRKVGNLIGAILSPFAKAGAWLLGKGADVAKGLGKGIAGALGKVASPLRSLAGRIKGWVGDLSRVLIGAGKAVIDGLVSGIKSRVSKVTNAVGSIGGKIKNTFKSVMGIFSPSRVMAELGRHTVAGLVQGMQSQHPAVAAAVSGLAGQIATAPSLSPAAVANARATGAAGGAMAGTVVNYNLTVHTDGFTPADAARELAWQLRTHGV